MPESMARASATAEGSEASFAGDAARLSSVVVAAAAFPRAREGLGVDISVVPVPVGSLLSDSAIGFLGRAGATGRTATLARFPSSLPRPGTEREPGDVPRRDTEDFEPRLSSRWHPTGPERSCHRGNTGWIQDDAPYRAGDRARLGARGRDRRGACDGRAHIADAVADRVVSPAPSPTPGRTAGPDGDTAGEPTPTPTPSRPHPDATPTPSRPHARPDPGPRSRAAHGPARHARGRGRHPSP